MLWVNFKLPWASYWGSPLATFRAERIRDRSMSVNSARILDGQSVLIVDDEPVIVIDLAEAFAEAGAKVTTTSSFQQAAALVEHDGLTAAVLDHNLGEGNSSPLCERLASRHIPFVTYSGYSAVEGPCSQGPHISKPADPAVIIQTIANLLRSPSSAASATHDPSGSMGP